MKQLYRYSILSATALVILSGCASYHVRQGNGFYNSLAYTDAIVEYQKALTKKDFPEADIKLAECYRMMNNTKKAEDAFAKVVHLKEAEPIHKLRYAQLLMRSGKYPEAEAWLDTYLKDSANDVNAKILRQSCDSIEAFKKDSSFYTISTMAVNTGQTNFSPQYYKDGIVFISDRTSGNGKVETYRWTGRPFLDLYFAKKDQDGTLGIPEKIKGDINGLYHDGSCAFIGDTVMYFTRNDYLGKSIETSSTDFVNLKISKSILRDSVWTNITDFPYNSNDYNTGHPTITKDGTTMYFVSDMPGGFGGTDIYVTKNENGKWSKPQNLGATINTPYNEMFPAIHNDTVLYFSSEGHYNMGGLDIFYSINNKGSWSEPENMKYPINSSYDDFGVIMNDSASQGYFSSNRNTSNTMLDNIYGFAKLVFTLDGIAVEKQTQKPIPGVLIELTNLTSGEKFNAITGDDGKFMFILDKESDYKVLGSKDGYYTNTEKATTKGKTVSENMHVKLKLELEQIIINKPIALENIYYDLDKWAIRPDAEPGLNKLVNIMLENPGIKVELGSHTDSRADDNYNMKLSQKRAESAVDYIVNHGIGRDRITAKGYGETMLVNRCVNKVKCSEEEHQQNRRTEFKVVGFVSEKRVSMR